VPGTLPLRVTAPIQRPFAIQDLSDFYPITGRRLMQSFPLSTVAATAISSIANPRYHSAVNHDPPLRSLDVLSVAGERAHAIALESCEASLAFEASILVIGHRQSVSPHPSPTSTALIGSLGGLLC
jgi:hypothetical protein